jgi:hypothetical protein
MSLLRRISASRSGGVSHRLMVRGTALAIAVLVVPLAHVANAHASVATFTGSVSATGNARQSHSFSVAANGTLSAMLTWSTPTARLSLGLSRRNSDGSWTWVTGVSGSQPERLNATVTPGTWRVNVKAKSGDSRYTVTVSYPGDLPPTGSAYLTIMLGRAAYAQALDRSCQVTTDQSKTLLDVATELAARGLSATVPITLSQIQEATHECVGGIVYASWQDLAQLRDVDGWDAVPRGPTNDVITGLAGQALVDATCGVLPAFYAHGYPDAWGLYAYPQNRFTTADQQVVSSCYAYGRRYTDAGYSNHMPLPAPYWQHTVSVNGGQCNNTALACSSDANVKNNRRYMLPSTLDAGVRTAPDSWASIQFYRFVTGQYGSMSTPAGQPAWDCSGTDPRPHWSHLPETYCWNDFLAFLDGLPAGVIDASPADVAREYNRSMEP